MLTYNIDEKMVKIEENMRRDSGHRGFILSDCYIAPFDENLTGVPANVMVFGEPETGKTSNIVLPNILDMRSSYVVIDRGGEIYRRVKRTLQNNGYTVKLFDISRPCFSSRYNPFAYMHKADPLSVWNVVDKLTEGLSEHNAMWHDAERNLLASVLFLQIEEYGVGYLNLGITYNILKECLKNGRDEFDELFHWPEADGNDGEFAKRTYRIFKQASAKTRHAVHLELLKILSDFAKPEIQQFIIGDDFNFETLKAKKTAIFVNPNSVYENANMLIPLFIMQAYETLENVKVSEKACKRPVPVAFILDDFCNVGTILNFALHVSVNSDIHTIMVARDESQIKECYGADVLDILMNRIGYVVHLHPNGTCSIQMDTMSLDDSKTWVL